METDAIYTCSFSEGWMAFTLDRAHENQTLATSQLLQRAAKSASRPFYLIYVSLISWLIAMSVPILHINAFCAASYLKSSSVRFFEIQLPLKVGTVIDLLQNPFCLFRKMIQPYSHFAKTTYFIMKIPSENNRSVFQKSDGTTRNRLMSLLDKRWIVVEKKMRCKSY